MNKFKGVYLNEHYSDTKQVRQYVNERIDSLKQLLDERKVQLNIQLDSIEVGTANEEEKSKKLIGELIEYEKVTINLFGEGCSHLATIKSNIESLENGLSRKKLNFQWNDKTIVDNLMGLGVIAYESSDVHNRVQSDVTTKTGEIITKGEAEAIKPTESYEIYDDIIEVFSKPNDLPDNTSIIYEDYSDGEEISYQQPSEYDPSCTNRGSHGNASSLSRYQTQSATFGRGNNREMAMLNSTGANKERSMTMIPAYKRSNSMNEINIEHDYQSIDESTLIDIADEVKRYEPEKKLPIRKCHSVPSKKAIKKLPHDLPVSKWGDNGEGIRQLNKPKGVCVSEKGNIFVAEKGNSRVQVFSPGGQNSYIFGDKLGNNAMIEPNGIWVTNHFVFVTLTNLHTVQMYTLQGGFVKKKSKEGKEKGKLSFPVGITGDNLGGKLYICDTGNNRIQIFDMNLNFIKVMKTGTQLYCPLDIKVVNMGNLVIVLDRSPRCIHMFKSSGETIRDIIEVQSFPKLVNPSYLDVDTQGNVFLSDYSSHCILVFTERGEFIWCLGEAVGKPFTEPRGIAFDNRRRLVTVCNQKKDQLQIFEVYHA